MNRNSKLFNALMRNLALLRREKKGYVFWFAGDTMHEKSKTAVNPNFVIKSIRQSIRRSRVLPGGGMNHSLPCQTQMLMTKILVDKLEKVCGKMISFVPQSQKLKYELDREENWQLQWGWLEKR